MNIELQSLTKCEVAPDGRTVVFGIIDGSGEEAQFRLSVSQVGALAMTPPNLINRALRLRYDDHTLRYAYPLNSWTVEQSSDPDTRMATLRTSDGLSVCFSMQYELQQKFGKDLIIARLIKGRNKNRKWPPATR